ncbi:Globin-like domain and Globin, structural domain-containing protein [Aphelenchoides besseyi]|nr:Globin-like domain and Globin, structural domain-containing protein [Aphelenchoides besseyi]
MNLIRASDLEAIERVRRPSVGLRRGSKVRDNNEWVSSASCKAPRASYTFSVQQCERFRQQQSQPQSTWLYSQPLVGSTSAASDCSRELPTIRVSLPPRNSRRCSISSPLRFTRTVSQGIFGCVLFVIEAADSIDSLERVCLFELRRQRLLEEERNEMPQPNTSERRLSMIAAEGSRHQLLSRQLSQNDPRGNGNSTSKELDSPNVLSATSAAFRLQTIGRSKTDPGGDETPEVATRSLCPVQRRSPPTLPLPTGERRQNSQTKRSTPDLVLDGVVNRRILSEAIGLSVYQRQLLLNCWPNLFATGTNGHFASSIFANLCQRNVKARQLMQKADGVAVFSNSGTDCSNIHAKLTLELIDSIIRNLDSPPGPTIAWLNEIGSLHRSLRNEGLCASMWDDLGDAILEGVRKNELVRKHKELRRAWLAVLAFITDGLKNGQSLFRSSPSPSTEIAQIRLQ